MNIAAIAYILSIPLLALTPSRVDLNAIHIECYVDTMAMSINSNDHRVCQFALYPTPWYFLDNKVEPFIVFIDPVRRQINTYGYITRIKAESSTGSVALSTSIDKACTVYGNCVIGGKGSKSAESILSALENDSNDKPKLLIEMQGKVLELNVEGFRGMIGKFKEMAKK